MAEAIDQPAFRERVEETFPKLRLPESFKATPFGPDWFGETRMLGFLTAGWAIDATSFTTVFAAATKAVAYDPHPWNGDVLLHDFTVDAATFEILSPWFARDCNHVYFGAVRIGGANPRCFVRDGEKGCDWSDDRCFYQVWGSTDGWTSMTTLTIYALDCTVPASDWSGVCSTDYVCPPPRHTLRNRNEGPVEMFEI